MIRASVIIPTRDRADILRLCLESLTRQSLPPEAFEVIVVDNGSRDATPQVAREFSGRLQLRYAFAAEPGLHVGRHEGWRRARSDVLTFADDDIEAEPTWIEAIANAFKDPRVALVGGNNHPKFAFEPPAWLARWWAEPVGRGRALGYLSVLDFGAGRFEIDPAYVWGCNFSVRRQALDAVGGFHPDGMPKESLRFRGDGESHVAHAVRACGFTALFDGKASVHHQVSANRMTPAYFEQRAYAQGVSDSYSAIRKHRSAALPAMARLRARIPASARAMRERLRAIGARGDAAAALLDVRLRAARAYCDGFAFHQSEVRADPALLKWVLKESYLP